MDFVINHKRFSKTYENEEAKKYSFSKNRIRRFPIMYQVIIIFLLIMLKKTTN